MLGLEVSNLKDSHQQHEETIDSGKSKQLELHVTEQAGFKFPVASSEYYHTLTYASTSSRLQPYPSRNPSCTASTAPSGLNNHSAWNQTTQGSNQTTNQTNNQLNNQ